MLDTTKLYVLTSVILIGLAGCDNGNDSEAPSNGDTSNVTVEEVEQETDEAVDTAGKYAESKVKEYKQEMRGNLEQIDQAIDQITAETKDMTGAAKQQAENTVETLRQQRDALAAKLNEASGTPRGHGMTLKLVWTARGTIWRPQSIVLRNDTANPRKTMTASNLQHQS